MHRAVAALLLAGLLAGCSVLPRERSAEPRPVRKAPGELVVAAWAEPPRLPRGGGQAQILVRIQKRGGAPYPGVEVRLAATSGRLYSRGRLLVTDGRGMTRDRLTTRETSVVTLTAGGTRYSFKVAVGGEPPR